MRAKIMNKRRKSVLFIFLTAIFLLSLFASVNVWASDVYNTDYGTTVLHKNYDITTDGNGKYSEYFITGAHSYYSGGDVDFGSGYMYETSKDEAISTVRLLDGYAGNFNIIAQGFMENLYKSAHTGGLTDSDGNVPDYKTVRFVFSDRNSNEKILLTFRQNEWNYLELTVYYIDAQENEHHSDIIRVAGSFVGITGGYNTNYPLEFDYNTKNHTITVVRASDAWGYATVALNGLFDDTVLPVFDAYSVDLQITDKSMANTGKFLIYELCNQPMAGQTLINKAGAVLVAGEFANAIRGFSYALPKVYAFDVLDGDKSAQVVQQVLSPAAEPMDLTDNTFVPPTSGTYTVKYTVADSGGIVSNLTKELVVLDEMPTLSIKFDGTLENVYPKNGVVRLPNATAYSGLSPYGTELSYYVQVQKDGIVKGRYESTESVKKFFPEQIGKYTVLYVFKNELNLYTTKSFHFEAQILPYFEDLEFSEPLHIGKAFEVPTVPLILENERFASECSIKSPSDQNVAVVNNTFVPEEKGTYTFTYTKEYEGAVYQTEFTWEAGYVAEALFENISGCPNFEADQDLPAYSEKGNGVKILGNALSSTFRFANPIDLRALHSTDNIIELQVLSGTGYAAFSSMTVELIDVENPKNTVKISYRKNTWSDTYSYVLMNYDGRNLGRRNEAGVTGVVDSTYGAVTLNSFSGYKYSSKPQFGIQCDYENKQFFVNYTNSSSWMLLDLDDPNQVGAGKEWGGFTSGKAYVQVTMSGLMDFGGVIVTQVGGQSLSGKLVDDSQAPTIYFEKNDFIEYDTMPVGVVGQKYSIPNAIAYDLLTTVPKVDFALYYTDSNNATQLVEVNKEGYFIPDKTGDYYIIYHAVDAYKNVGEERLDFSVNETIDEIQVVFETSPDTASVGTWFHLPEIRVTGGSGKVRIDFRLYYNNKTLDFTDKIFYLKETGEIKLVYSAEDYLGNTKEGVLQIPVIAADSPVITVYDPVPVTVYKNQKVELPDFDAYDHAQGKEAEDKWICVDGVRIDGRSFTAQKNKGEQYKIEYCAGTGVNVTKVTYFATVLDPVYISDYLVFDDSNVTVQNEKLYTGIVSQNDVRISLPQLLVGNNLIIRFSIDPLHNDFESIEISLRDSKIVDQNIILTITRNDDKTSLLRINGENEREITIEGSFLSRAAEFYLIFDDRTKSLTDKDGKTLAVVDRFSNGVRYNGFNDGTLYMTCAIKGVVTTGSLELIQISNQTFTSSYSGTTLLKYTDRTAPNVYYSHEIYNQSVSIGANFSAPAAFAYDVLSGQQPISLTISAPDGTVVKKNVSCETMQSLVLNAYGYWTFSYETQDNGRKYVFDYFIKVKDEVSPEIVVNGSYASEISQSSKLTVLDAQVRDNYYESCELYIFLKLPSAKLVQVKVGEELSFQEKGMYSLIYYALDDEYNFAEKAMIFEVK